MTISLNNTCLPHIYQFDTCACSPITANLRSPHSVLAVLKLGVKPASTFQGITVRDLSINLLIST